MKQAKTWAVVALYAMAMAWVESAVVYYLRTMIDRLEPYQPNPLPVIGRLGPVELVREAATLMMLLTVGILAGRSWRSRLAYSAIAFGVWDISYYAFLRIMYGWPHSMMDWDILFLLPLPWWGPVLAPVLISLLMIAWGSLTCLTPAARFSWRSDCSAWGLSFLGMALALYVFMTDTLRVAGQGVEVVRNVLPTQFNWLLFIPALVLMAAPILQAWRGASQLRSAPVSGAAMHDLARASERAQAILSPAVSSTAGRAQSGDQLIY